MLSVFLAYLCYLPVHVLSGEHCPPGLTAGLSTSEVAGHVHHEHRDGSTHHQHHTTEEDEVEFAGKIGPLKWIASVSAGGAVILLEPPIGSAPAAANHDVLPRSFSPGHWLVSRGPPRA